jgi:addiction module HigA family antidote
MTAHPGAYIKNHVIPADMNVTEAAKQLEVARPTLSRLLNGKAALSREMATKVASAFGVDSEKLLEMQYAFDSITNEEARKEIAVRTYVPAFLQIRADDIDTWAGRKSSREELATLIRRLVNSTGKAVSSSDFPAGEDSEAPGWDGRVENDIATPWIPRGKSGWEFGCNSDVQKKANSDYKKRTDNTDNAERQNLTFVFVSPRKWPEKETWAERKNKEGKWKAVRALDARDLEQWLEISPQTQAWLAPQVGKEAEGCFSLPDTWERWSNLADPPISPAIFNSEIDSHFEDLQAWVNGDRKSPLIVTASSREEALACVCAAVNQRPELSKLGDNALVFATKTAVTRLRDSLSNLISVTFSGEIDRAVAEVTKGTGRIVISERRTANESLGLYIDLPTWESFNKAALEMGLAPDRVDYLARATSHSPTILRRMLGSSPDLRYPKWAKDVTNVKRIAPLVFAGVWSATRDGDQDILAYLANQKYEVIEEWISELCALDDSPIWSESTSRGVVSRRECFDAISRFVTADILDRFFDIAEYVLGEDNPALDLEKSEQWAAEWFKKGRDHSRLIRDSLADNLILVAIHGQELFGDRLGYSVEGKVNRIVRDLLANGSPRAWQSMQHELPRLAEAAPDTFLEIVEEELSTPEPAFAALFQSVEGGIFGNCDRTGMLWALELLAWRPEYLTRVIRILAKLCVFKLEDNWANKPSGSIRDILLFWRPHTVATVEQRKKVITDLCKTDPDVGWRFIIEQLQPHPSMTSGTYKPRWRGYAGGHTDVVTYAEANDVRLHCLDLALSWHTQTLPGLRDLVKLFRHMPDANRKRVLDIVSDWVARAPRQDEMAILQEDVRTSVLTKRSKRRKKIDDWDDADGRALYDLLAPSDMIEGYRWLFQNTWVEESADELEEEEINFKERDERVLKLRTNAVRTVFETLGNDGIRRLCELGDTSFLIGAMLGRHVLSADQQLPTAIWLFEQGELGIVSLQRCLNGFLGKFDDVALGGFVTAFLSEASVIKSDDEALTFLSEAPFRPIIWNIAEQRSTDFSRRYWEAASVSWGEFSDVELNVAARQLLSVERPVTAFNLVRLDLKCIETDTLTQLLYDLATKNEKEARVDSLRNYSLVEALKTLDARDNVDRAELTRIEQLYVRGLGYEPDYKFPNLSRAVAENPEMYFQLIAMVFSRSDKRDDASELGLPSDPEGKKNGGEFAFHALEKLSVMPGTDEKGKISASEMLDWMRAVRTLAQENDRLDITDEMLGQFLQRSPTDDDGTWPCAPVRQTMEAIATRHLGIGFTVAIHNERGMHARPDHGGPERDLAEKYRKMAEPFVVDSPFVARCLLGVADDYDNEAKHNDAEGRAKRRYRE